nr:DUF3795 domain-containing protein [Candidatus Njordarchaeum guaymaensis]
MVDRRLVGKCGLYCGACPIFRAHNDGGEYLRKVAKHFECPPEKVRCYGCMTLKPDCWGYDCKIVQCLRNRGMKFCYQCDEYKDDSCERFGQHAADYAEDGVNLRANLERIKNGETNTWLTENGEKYRCPTCRKPLSLTAITRKCYDCGKDLSSKST